MKRLYKATAAILSILVLIAGSSLIYAMDGYEVLAEEEGLAYVTESSLDPLMLQQEAVIQPQEWPAPEMQMIESQPQEQPAPEMQMIESQPQEQPAPEVQAPEFQPQEQPAPESHPQEQPTPESHPQEQPTPESQPQEQPAPENQPQEQPAPENQPQEQPAPESQPQEQPAPENQPQEQPTSESQSQEQPVQEPQEPETPPQIPSDVSEQNTDPENADTVYQLNVVPVKAGITFEEEELLANTAYSEMLEIMNISGQTMTDIELTIWSEDSRFIITSFKDLDELQTALNETDTEHRSAESAESYRKRTLRIKELMPGMSVKTEIVLWVQDNMKPDSPGTEAQLLCEFSANGGRYACRGSWKIVPEEPSIEPEDTAPEQTESTDQEQSETTDQEQPETTEPEQPETAEPEPAETEPLQETPEEPETVAPEQPEVTDPEQPERTEKEAEKEEKMEDQLINFDIINEKTDGEEENQETDEYFEDYSYDDGSYYYDDWVVYDGVSGADQINTAVPYLLVKSYSHRRVIKTGDAFGLEVTLLNTSQKLKIENVMIKIETSDSLSLSNGTNTLFVSAVEAGGTTTQSMNLLAASECKDTSQKITLNITYDYVENKERKQGTATECITIPVSQQDRLELRDPVIDYMEAGQEGVISVSYVNKGFSSLYNMEAAITLENAEAVQNVVYAGNVESGKSGTLDFLVTPLEEGDCVGEITLRYENASQKEVAVAIPLNFTSTTAYVEDGYLNGEEDYMTEEVQEQASFPWIWVAAAGAALILAVVITVILVRRKKKAEAKQEDMLDDWYETLNAGSTGAEEK